MSGTLASSYSTAEWMTIALAALLLVLVAVIGWRAWKASRITPAERERRRRKMLIEICKMGDATLIDYRDGYVIYSYDVRGVEYTASQDVSALTSLLPDHDTSIAGPVSVKYDARNPANSIILGEEWSGLHSLSRHQ